LGGLLGYAADAVIIILGFYLFHIFTQQL
jgi:hypothetical protein